jgi:hypothetical protein
MSFHFHPEAEAELNLSIDYYESIDPRLGYDFALEVYETIQRIVDFPKAWPSLDGDVRRALVKRFPYGVLYSEEADGYLILAVMDLHRAPDYWKHRG